MKTVLFRTLILASLLWLPLAASAQDSAEQNSQPDWHQIHQEFFKGKDWRSHLFARVKDDIDHVRTEAYSGVDRSRLDNAELQLTILQSQVEGGIFDHQEERELDSAIASLGKLATNSRLRSDDRQVMNEDRNLMREYRRHHDNWPGEQH